jgi:hypothetical protein
MYRAKEKLNDHGLAQHNQPMVRYAAAPGVE